MPTATIKLFLPYGDPSRFRTAEIFNWIGKAVAGPRADLDILLSREEAENPGIYMLTGRNADENERETIYIGEAETIKSRIRQHIEKDYWNQLVYFISKDENLTKAHIRYLEGELIALAKKAARATVKNDQGSGAKLPENDRADMDVFLGRMQQLLPILGIQHFIPVGKLTTENSQIHLLTCQIKGLKATGYVTTSGFVVMKGSQAVLLGRPGILPWTKNLRVTYANNQNFKLSADKTHYVFTKDTEFSSPSAASAVVKGGNSNGRTAWVDENGKNLHQIEAEKYEKREGR